MKLMINEDKNGFFSSWQEDLEKEIEKLKKEKQEERRKYESELKEWMRRELAEYKKQNDKKNNHLDSKFKKIYYWLFGITLALLAIISGTFFYLRNSK